MPRIGAVTFTLSLCLSGCLIISLSGCKGPEEAKFTRWAETPRAEPYSGSFAKFVQIGEAVEQSARARAFYKGKPTTPITARTTFFAKEKVQANQTIGTQKAALIALLGAKVSFQYTPVGLSEPPIYLRGIRLIGESMIWDIENSLANENLDLAVQRVAQITRLNGVLLGGGAYEASLGISLSDRARRLISPELARLGAGQLGTLGKQLSAAIALRAPLESCLKNEQQNMLLSLQQAQDYAQKGDFKGLGEKLGKSTNDEITLLASLKKTPTKVAGVFDWIGADIRERGNWHVEKMKNPQSEVAPPKLKDRKNWRIFYRYFASTLDSLAPYARANAARTQLLMLESFLRQKVKLKGTLPTDLTAFSKPARTDPFTGKPFQYRAGSGEFRIYSAGTDGVDDGGESNPTFDSPDLVLEKKR